MPSTPSGGGVCSSECEYSDPATWSPPTVFSLFFFHVWWLTSTLERLPTTGAERSSSSTSWCT